MFGDKIQPPGGATINRLTICIDMYHITGKISADERVVEEITPDQPSAVIGGTHHPYLPPLGGW